MQTICQAVTNAERHPTKTSGRYSVASTKMLIDAARREGFSVHSIKYPKRRNASKYALHEVRLNLPGLLPQVNQEGLPQIVISNSHDGSSALKLMVGIYRLICSNGLLAGNAFCNVSIRHIGLTESILCNALQDAAQKTVLLHDFMQQKQQTRLVDRFNFARECLLAASELRDMSFNEVSSLVRYDNLSRVLRPRRIIDLNDSAWHTFNVVQENLINPANNNALQYKKDDGNYGTLRRINSIKDSQRLNQRLWDIASIAESK